MRAVAGPRNRIILTLAGVLAILAGAWMLSPLLPLTGLPPQLNAVLPEGEMSAGALLGPGAPTWSAAATFAVAVLVAVVGLLLLLMQLPASPPRLTVRIADEEGSLLGSLQPDVLERALTEAMQTITGVDDGSVRFTGSARASHVYATTTVAADSDIAWVVTAVRRQLSDDVKSALGTAPLTVDLLIRLRSGSPSRTSTHTRNDESATNITQPEHSHATYAEAMESAPTGAQ